MKKIALITIHYANSYGGCLQALAAQTVLSRYGETYIIDYKTSELANTMKLLRFSKSLRSGLHLIKDAGRLLPRKRLLNRFQQFMQENYKLTEPCHSYIELKKLSEDFDVFVCGSDQIWNPAIVGSFDKNYMLDFVENKKKMSFSTSAGSYKYNNEEESYIKDSIKSFSSLSFREEDTVKYLKDLSGHSDVSCTLDPTLLLDKKEWMKVLKLPNVINSEKYIFVYTLKKDKLVYDTVKRIAKEYGLKIVAVDQDPFLLYKTDKHVRDASPLDYVSLINNASFVVTNSFHGTAFAVNFGIPFISIKPESGVNRIRGFLKNIGLEERLIESIDELDKVISKSIDFSDSHNKLDDLKKKTYEYLNRALE